LNVVVVHTFFFKEPAGALLCHLREEKQVRVLTVGILHKQSGTQTLVK